MKENSTKGFHKKTVFIQRLSSKKLRVFFWREGRCCPPKFKSVKKCQESVSELPPHRGKNFRLEFNNGEHVSRNYLEKNLLSDFWRPTLRQLLSHLSTENPHFNFFSVFSFVSAFLKAFFIQNYSHFPLTNCPKLRPEMSNKKNFSVG